MSTISHPHDAYFKSAMSNKAVAQAFFQQYLPNHILSIINLNQLELANGQLINQKLKSSLVDLLFTVPIGGESGYLYLLVEHQSKSDTTMAFRLWHYAMQVLHDYVKSSKKMTLPIVFPLVFYNGKTQYAYSTDFYNLFGSMKALAKQTMLQPFHLIDLRTDSKASVEDNWCNLMIYVMKYIHVRDMIHHLDTIALMIMSVLKKGGRSYVESTLSYLLANRPLREKQLIMNLLNHYLCILEEDNPMISIADGFIQEGMQQGMQQGVRQVAKRMLQKGMPIKAIVEMTGLSGDELKILEAEKITN